MEELRKRSLDRGALIAVGLVVALLVVDASIAHNNMRGIADDAQQVIRAHVVQERYSSVLRILVDAESGQRGFLLTGNDAFLEPYAAARSSIDAELAALAELAKDDLQDQARLDRLTAASNALLGLLADGIEQKRNRVGTQTIFAAADRVKLQTDAIRAMIAETQRIVKQELQAHERSWGRTIRFALVSGILTLGLGLGLFALFVYLVLRNIRLRERASQLVTREREQLRVTLASIGDAVIATDTAGHVTLLNGVAQSLTGWSQAEACGQPLEQVFHIVNESSRQPVENPVLRVLSEGCIIGLANHTLLISRDGTERPIADSAAPIRDADGQLFGAVLVFRDVTEEAQEDRARAERLRLAALRADISFALVQADDFRFTLEGCMTAFLTHLDVALAAVWMLDETGQTLELQATAALDTPLAERHRRIPVGQSLIGRIAARKEPHCTTDLASDPEVSSLEWVADYQFASFAGFPLAIEGRVIGVVALFSRFVLNDTVLDELAPLAEGLTQYIERRRSEDARRLGEEQFRTLADSIPNMAWMLRPDGHVFWYNQRWYDYTGSTLEAMEGSGWQAVHDPAELPRVLASFQRSLETGEPWEEIFPLRRSDGEFRWHLSRMLPVRDHHGTIVRWFGTNTDITQQREVEAALRRSEARFRELADALPQMVWVARADGYHEYFNQRWYEYIGGGQDESVGQGWNSPLHPHDRQRAVYLWAQALKSGEPYDIEYRLLGKDGEYRWFLGRAVPIRDDQGAIAKWIGTCTDIDDKKRAEEALRRSEAFVRGVVESSPDCVMVLGLDGRLLWMNEHGQRMMEIDDFETVRDTSYLSFWRGRDIDADVEIALEAARHGGEGRFRGLCCTRSNRALWWDVVLTPILGPDDKPEQILGVSRDVSEQLEIEMRVRESETNLRRIIDSMFSFVGVLTPDGILIEANRSPVELAGLAREEVIGRKFWDCHWWSYDNAVVERLRAAFERATRGEMARYDEVIRMRGDQLIVIDFLLQPVYENGELKFVIPSGVDITDRKLAEQATRKRSEQLRGLAEIATHLTVAQNVQSILNVIAHGARSIVGVHQAICARTCDPNTSERTACSMSEKYDGHAQVVDLDLKAPLYDEICGEQMTICLTESELAADPRAMALAVAHPEAPPLRGLLASPLRGLDGRTIGVMILSDKYEGDFHKEDDVVLLLQLAQMASVALENARLFQEIRDADRRKDLFLATLAHELRNPLSPLMVAVQLIGMEPDNGQQVRELGQVLSRQCAQLKRLIDDLLDVSRISSGKLNLRRDPVPLGEAIHAAIDVARPLVVAARHELVVTVPPEPVVVLGDSVRLAQIVGNLLINSAKYTPPGGRIELVLSSVGDEAEIRVQDNGIGIPEHMLTKVFGLFTQVDSSHTRSQSGLGIGLTLVHTLVEMHSGSIAAHSAGPGLGSTFIVRLPLTTQPLAAPSEVARDADATAPPRGFRILIVDDNRSAAYLLSRLLQKIGQTEVRLAESAGDALKVIADEQPEIVISDIAMPGISGYELARRIRSSESFTQPYLIALTGYGQESDREEALAAGFDEHLVKPIDWQSLRRLLAARGVALASGVATTGSDASGGAATTNVDEFDGRTSSGAGDSNGEPTIPAVQDGGLERDPASDAPPG